MLNEWELNSLYDIFLHVRNDPENENHEKMLLSAVRVLEQGPSCDEISQNRFFDSASDVLSQEELKRYGFYQYDKNANAPKYYVRDERVHKMVLKVCRELLNALRENDSEKTVDLADALHNLPGMLVNASNTVPDRFWETQLTVYRNKWDKNFLTDEENELQSDNLRIRKKRAKRKFLFFKF